MSHREIMDAEGVRWQVWDVVPARAERRQTERRDWRRADPARLRGERRRTSDRRLGSDPEPRARVAPELAQGWLVFESRAERRRLVPIPQGWDQLSDADLRALLTRAAVLAQPRRRLVE